MNFLFRAADRYLQDSDWKTLAIIKFCLCSMGILIGCFVPEKQKKYAAAGSAAVFVGTYIPLMAKLFCVFRAEAKAAREE